MSQAEFRTGKVSCFPWSNLPLFFFFFFSFLSQNYKIAAGPEASLQIIIFSSCDSSEQTEERVIK